MHKKIIPEVLERTVADTFLIKNVHFLQQSRNLVLETQSDTLLCIIRLTDMLDQTEESITAELDWIQALADSGIPVCTPFKVNSRFIHQVQFGPDSYHCTFFKKAPGRKIESSDLGPALFTSIGEMVGLLHTTVRTHPLPRKRAAWYDSVFLTKDMDRFLSEKDAKVKGIASDLIKKLRAIPEQSDNFGLVHADFHFHNLFLDNGKLWLFDFDNCEYGYFANDIATALHDCSFTWIRMPAPGEAGRKVFYGQQLKEYQRKFWLHFWEGYCRHNTISQTDLACIRDFYRLREIILYVHHNEVWNNIKTEDPYRQYLDFDRKQIENGGWEFYV